MKNNIYVGARYVPLLYGEWDKTISYEPLTIVTYQGASYTSKTIVPIGVDIINTKYWVCTGNYNAQIEMYRSDISALRTKINELVFRCVEDMRDCESLQVGDIVNTLGYYSVSDGGEAFYIITDTVDEYSYQENVGDLYATLVYGEIVCPRMFGAKGDGVTDDTIAIQNCINSGNKILFNSGTYLVDAEISVKAKSNSVIDLNGCTLKAKTNNLEFYQILDVDGVENVVIKNGKIIGDRDTHIGNTGEWGYGIRINASKNVSVSDVYIEKCWGDGIVIRQLSEEVIIDRCFIKLCRRQGITVSDCSDVIITNNIIQEINGTAPMAGIDVEPNEGGVARNILIKGNMFKNNKGHGLHAYGGDNTRVVNLVVVDNVVTDTNDCDDGFSLASVTNCTVSNNVVQNSKLKRAFLVSGCASCNISNNTVKLVDAEKLIYVINSSKCTFNNNIFDNCNSLMPMQLQTINYCQIKGNVFNRCTGENVSYGDVYPLLYLTGSGQNGSCYNTICDNVFDNVSMYKDVIGFGVKSDYNEIISNKYLHGDCNYCVKNHTTPISGNKIIGNVFKSGTVANYCDHNGTMTYFNNSRVNNIIDGVIEQ